MFHRRHTACLAVLAVVALACEGSQGAGARPTDRPKPSGSPRAGTPASMAALGDSITAGYGSCVTLVACRRNSWSTGGGTTVDSHYRRIRRENAAIAGHTKNLSVPGARARDLPGQAAAAVREDVDYVTVLIGANDVCTDRVQDMTTAGTFRRHLDATLRTLHKGLPDARVLVVSVPDVYRLWEVGHDDPRAVRAWNRGVCPALLANPTSTAAVDDRRRKQVRDRVDEYNRELSRACRSSDGHCRYDGGRAHRVRFTLDLLNRIDYFHANAAGQQKLAEVTFPRSFTW